MINNPHSPGCPWYTLAEQYGGGSIKYCESTLCAWVVEPANTYSNFAFLIVALLIYKTEKNKSINSFTYTYISLLSFLGLSSFYYHMSNTFFTQLFDYIGMFCIIYWFAALNLLQLKWKKNLVIFCYFSVVFMSIALVLLMANFELNFQLMVAFAAMAFLFSEVITNKHRVTKAVYKNLIIAVLCFIAGHTLSILDMKRIWCDPDNHWIQGHALWHVLSAVGFYFCYKFIRQFQVASNKIN